MRGRPKTSTKVPKNASDKGTKPGEVRATFLVNEGYLEDLKALAYYDRKSIKDTLNTFLQEYLKARAKDLTQARKIYKKNSTL